MAKESDDDAKTRMEKRNQVPRATAPKVTRTRLKPDARSTTCWSQVLNST